MEFFTFKNGDQIPMLGLGTWKSAKGEVYNAIRNAIEIGYRHFDCAAIYGNEKEIGEAIKDAIDKGEVKRSDLWITSKLWNTSHKKEQVEPALMKTLSDLKLDYLDLYLMHWPIAIKTDAPFPFKADAFIPLSKTPLEETWGTMYKCQLKGMIKQIGVANFNIPKINHLTLTTNITPAVNQIELHPYLQQNGISDFCRKNNILLTAYSPLGSRDRPGVDQNIPNLFTDQTIRLIADNHNCTTAQVLIKWSIQRGVSVIPKSVNPKRLKENFDSQQINLSAKEMDAILKLDRNYRFIDGSFFTPPGSPYTMENIWNE